MRRITGAVCLFLGAVLIFGALTLFVHNQHEEAVAESRSEDLMPVLMEAIEEKEKSPTEPPTYEQPVGTPVEYLDPDALIMTEVEIDGDKYIGYLSIPSLELELPVMSGWDYRKLNVAPCRYNGSVRGEDLVIMAHNYDRHFGRLAELTEDDPVIFTDMDGIVTTYEVVGQDILSPYALEEMTSGDFDLTLFTCTYGGQSRVTVYCDRSS